MESLAALASKTGHDLNNFLMAILGNTSLAMMEMAEGAPHYRYLTQVEAAANRASDFAKDLLTFAGRGRCSFKLVDLSTMIREMEPNIAATLPDDCRLICDLQPDLLPVQADATQLRQVISGIVKNCCEAMEGQGGEIQLRTGECELQGAEFLYIARSSPETRYLYLEIEDCGTGMTDEVAKHMFDPFFSTKAKGRGSGLAGIYGIIRAHRGNFIVDSKPEHGTRVRILLPSSESFARESAHLLQGRY
ncbi:hypothetical protein IT570_08735 [Candidatus Sumerlaeota bacterium]|nr:hypothetical protein [Candidatus Sumerlaeota bacterium]